MSEDSPSTLEIMQTAVNAEAELQTGWFQEARRCGGPLTPDMLKELQFRSRVSVSDLERQIGRAIKKLPTINQQLQLKQDMRDLRDFLKQSLQGLAQASGNPLVFSSFARLGTYVLIAPSMFGKAKAMPKGTGEHTGLFYEAYGSGQLHRLVKAKKGKTLASLWLGEGVSEGRYSNTAWVEEYHSNGTIEEYGALFQNDPKRATMSFGSWAVSRGFQVADS